MSNNMTNMEEITLGAGCFWCVEAVFQRLKGVESVVSGYSNGHKENPTYEEVCSGTTGHVENARITFDPQVVSVEEILEVFWNTHDPTTLNRQGNDIGTQYRSGVYYHNEQQKEVAEAYKAQLEASGVWHEPIVTEIVPVENYYPAENYHQNYYNQNPNQGYCAFVVRPKVDKFLRKFPDKVKAE